jgi:hypothetical protein
MSGFQFIPRSERAHDAIPIPGSVYSEQTQHAVDDSYIYPAIAVCSCYVRIRRENNRTPWEHAPAESVKM